MGKRVSGSIQKKNKAYYLVVRMKDSSGKWKQKWLPGGKTQREAKLKLAEMIGDVHKGTYKEIKEITFDEFSKLWLSTYAETKTKPSTLQSYQHIINNRLIPVMGDYYLTEIDTVKLQRYVALKLKEVNPKTAALSRWLTPDYLCRQ